RSCRTGRNWIPNRIRCWRKTARKVMCRVVGVAAVVVAVAPPRPPRASNRPMVVACIGLGANLGDAQATVRAAIQALGRLPQTRLLAASQLYRTPAWGNEAQPDFINAAATVETGLDPPRLLEHLLATEQA